MALIHIDGTGIIAWHFNTQGTDGDTVITLGYATGSTTIEDVAQKAMTSYGLNVQQWSSAHCVLHSVTVVQQIGGEKESALSFGEGDVPGLGVTSMLPANCAALVQKRTALAGRKHRGRFYIPGIPGDSVSLSTDCNTLTLTALSNLQARLDLFYDDLTSTTGGPILTPMILHPAPSVTGTPITSFSAQARLATQRGRLRD